MGLGLRYDIVKAHGDIRHELTEGKGARSSLHFY
jgi:hypothetical protein